MPGRAQFEETLVTEFKRAGRRASVLGLLFIELSPATDVQPTHPEGSGVAQSLADRQSAPVGISDVAILVRQAIGPRDFLARYSESTFCVVTTEGTPKSIEALAEVLRERIEADCARRAESPAVVRISGLCCLPRRNNCTYDQFLAAADEVIAESKAAKVSRISFKSLIGEADANVLNAVRSLLFSRFLLLRGTVSEEVCREGKLASGGRPYCIGRLARRLGWIGPNRLRRILLEQRTSHELFGQVAVRLGYLSPDRLSALLAIQQENPEEFTRFLVDRGAISEPQRRHLLRDYYRFLRTSRPAAVPTDEAP